MIRTGNSKNMALYIIKPFCIALLLFSLFGLVMIRSNVLKLEYQLGDLEKKEIEYLKERKMLRAEKASLLSFEKVNASFRGNHELVFPDRVRVIHVKRQKGVQPYKVSLEGKRIAEP